MQEVVNNGLSALKINAMNDESEWVELIYLPITEGYEYDCEWVLLCLADRIAMMLSGENTYEIFLYYLSLDEINYSNIAPEFYLKNDTYSFYRHSEESKDPNSIDYYIEATNNSLDVVLLDKGHLWGYTGGDSMSKLLYMLTYETLSLELIQDLGLELCPTTY